MTLRHKREDLTHVCGRSYREGGDRAAIGHAEEHPSIEKGDQVTVGFAQVDVLAAGVGKHRTQFGEGEAGAERDQRSENPYQQEQRRLRQRSGDVLCGEKDRGSDDAADQKQHGIEQVESTKRVGLPSGAVAFDQGRAAREDGCGFHLSDSEFVGRFKRRAARRQITAEQSPQVSGSMTSSAQLGQ